MALFASAPSADAASISSHTGAPAEKDNFYGGDDDDDDDDDGGNKNVAPQATASSSAPAPSHVTKRRSSSCDDVDCARFVSIRAGVELTAAQQAMKSCCEVRALLERNKEGALNRINEVDRAYKKEVESQRRSSSSLSPSASSASPSSSSQEKDDSPMPLPSPIGQKARLARLDVEDLMYDD